MASQSLYRKWRSQTFSDLVGQEAVVRTLLNAVRDGRLAHAYLFCGPRGTGKTSVARLLAKAVNCANPHDGEPCNECISCQEITAGRSPDVIEIDAASNTGVDNIRDLRESVGLLSTGGHYRVFVIDEVHMLSTPAFNALLKTLEEPPPHIIFVLATTEAHKVLPTIVSRCQRFNFGRFSMRDLVARLHHVAEGEGLELEPAAADLLARAAQGGMRDALSLLDQALAFCGTHIDLERTRTMLGLADPGVVRRIIEHVAKQQPAEGLHLINEMVTNGADLRQLNAQLSDEWRALVLARAGANVAALMDRARDEAQEIAALAQSFSLEELTACARVFARNDAPARGLPVPQLALELSFLECLAIKRNGGVTTSAPPATSTLTARPATNSAPSAPTGRAAHTATASLASPASAPSPPPAPPHPVESRHSPASPGVEELDLGAIASEIPVLASGEPVPRGTEADWEEPSLPPEPAAGASVDELFVDGATAAPYANDASAEWLGQAQSRWTLVKQVCKQKSMSVAALLNSARPILVEPGEVPTLVLQADYQFHLEKLRDPRSRAAIEWALEQVLSAPMRVRLALANGNGPTDPTGAHGPGGPRGGPEPDAPPPPGGNGGPRGNGDPRKSGGNGRSGENPRPNPRNHAARPDASAFASVAADAMPNSGNGQSGRNGDGATAPESVHDASAAYLPANVTPIRPARTTRRLEDEVRADAVIQSLLKSGIELSDVQPLEDEK